MTKKNTSKQTFKTSGQKFNAKSAKAQAKKTAPIETVSAPEETVANSPTVEGSASDMEQTVAEGVPAQETEGVAEPVAEQTMLADETFAQETAPEQTAEETPAQEETATSAPETTPAESQEAQATAPEQAAETTPEAAAAATPQRKVDPRLPQLGTILRRTDRHGTVRCECIVEEGGFRYAGTLYKTLSAAAIVAAKDLGLKSETQNGFTF